MQKIYLILSLALAATCLNDTTLCAPSSQSSISQLSENPNLEPDESPEDIPADEPVDVFQQSSSQQFSTTQYSTSSAIQLWDLTQDDELFSTPNQSSSTQSSVLPSPRQWDIDEESPDSYADAKSVESVHGNDGEEEPYTPRTPPTLMLDESEQWTTPPVLGTPNVNLPPTSTCQEDAAINAAHNNNTELVKDAVFDGININQQYEAEDGNTLLHIAAANNNPELTQFLCEQWADANIENDNGLTPTFYALGSIPDITVFKKLLEFNADPNHTSQDGQNICSYNQYALHRKKTAISPVLHFLIAAGLNPNFISNELMKAMVTLSGEDQEYCSELPKKRSINRLKGKTLYKDSTTAAHQKPSASTLGVWCDVSIITGSTTTPKTTSSEQQPSNASKSNAQRRLFDAEAQP